jgi:predicted branched-subunit amino acid permease
MDETLDPTASAATIRPSQAMLAGMRSVLPILPGVVPFGMIAGASAVAAGMSAAQSQLMSITIFAGASQVAAVDLMARGAAWWTMLLAVWVINSRMVMYGASLAPIMPRLRGPKAVAASYLLTDQAYAVTLVRADRHPSAGRLVRYYFGAALSLWTTWQASTAAGSVLGNLVPESWQLEFTIPLMFLALLAPVLKDRPAWISAITAGTVMLATRGLPNNLGLIVGVIAGIAAGMAMDSRRKREGEGVS